LCLLINFLCVLGNPDDSHMCCVCGMFNTKVLHESGGRDICKRRRSTKNTADDTVQIPSGVGAYWPSLQLVSVRQHCRESSLAARKFADHLPNQRDQRYEPLAPKVGMMTGVMWNVAPERVLIAEPFWIVQPRHWALKDFGNSSAHGRINHEQLFIGYAHLLKQMR